MWLCMCWTWMLHTMTSMTAHCLVWPSFRSLTILSQVWLSWVWRWFMSHGCLDIVRDSLKRTYNVNSTSIINLVQLKFIVMAQTNKTCSEFRLGYKLRISETISVIVSIFTQRYYPHLKQTAGLNVPDTAHFDNDHTIQLCAVLQ